MTTKCLGLIMNGVTGRMGLNQHLIRSIIAIRDQGGVLLANGDRMLPDPILIGRDAEKVKLLAKRFNVERWSTDLDKALAEKDDTIFFDAATTQARPSLLTKAINAGKVRLAIHDGDLLTESLTAPGFATSVHPDWSTMQPLAQPAPRISLEKAV